MRNATFVLCLLGFLLTGCDIHTHGTAYRTKTVYVEPEPVVVVTSTTSSSSSSHSHGHNPSYEEVVIVQEEPLPWCWDDSEYYAPFYHSADWCTDYGVGVGYCCEWRVDSYYDVCYEEYCWWDDICEWEFQGSECYYH